MNGKQRIKKKIKLDTKYYYKNSMNSHSILNAATEIIGEPVEELKCKMNRRQGLAYGCSGVCLKFNAVKRNYDISAPKRLQSK